jgi:hypothetical protein
MISGTSTEADNTVITIYKNGNSVGTTLVNSGAWSKTLLTGLAVDDVITAVASASGKCTSSTSAAVTVTKATATISVTPYTVTSMTKT